VDKIAVVVVETYSAKLVIANVVQDSYFSICDVEIEPIKFGLEMDDDHFLKKNQIMSIISTLKNFRKICDMFSVSKTIAIASFVKDTKPMNIYSFFDEVFVTCGFRFTLLSPEEQNMAIYTGIMNSYDIPKAIIVNVGADNIHLIQYNRRNILNQAYIPVGPKTLVEMYPIKKYGKDEAFEKVSKYIKAQLSDFDWIKNIEPEYVLVGNGYYFEDLSSMDRIYKKYPLDKDDGYVFNTADVEHILKQLKALDLDENKRLRNLYESRADVFAYAVELIKTIIDDIQRETITITTRSLVEGLLFNTVTPSTLEKPNSDIVGFSVMAQTSVYEADSTKHNEQVYNLSMLLFKQLRVLHKLPRGYVKVLRVASYMHDVGNRIGYKNHARHSFEVVLNSEIYGLTHRELILASFVASLHAGGDIKMSDWARYSGILTADDVEATKKLGVILRLAECFDRTKNSVIVDINCDILGDSVIMKTVTTADATFEIQRGMDVGKDFEKVFHKKLEIL
jgi:exopolyphosphatase/guanosine-5'-triphosphate,3'-diphosphate pyrophosphatase